MASKTFHDAHGNTYDRMSSGCTRTVAEKFLPELDPPISDGSYVLDNACGTGFVTRLIKAKNPAVRMMCADLAPGMLEIVKTHARENKWEGVDTTVLDVRELKTLKDDTFSHVITNFGFSPTPDDLNGPKKAAAEMYRVLKKGGVCVVTTWAERNFTEAMEAAALRIRPDEKPFKFDVPGDWGRGSWLVQELENAGFGHSVSLKSVDTAAVAGTLDELVSNMLLFKDMFYKGYTDDEMAGMPEILKEEMRKLPHFEETKDYARINMLAWIGIGWKK